MSRPSVDELVRFMEADTHVTTHHVEPFLRTLAARMDAGSYTRTGAREGFAIVSRLAAAKHQRELGTHAFSSDEIVEAAREWMYRFEAQDRRRQKRAALRAILAARSAKKRVDRLARR